MESASGPVRRAEAWTWGEDIKTRDGSFEGGDSYGGDEFRLPQERGVMGLRGL